MSSSSTTSDDSSGHESPEPTPGPVHAPARLNRVVFGASAVIIITFALFTLALPDTASAVIGATVAKLSSWFGWWYILLAGVVVAFALWLALSRHGRIRLGPEHSRPQFGMFTWAAMLFAAGIGIDLMFFAVAEPVSQYLAPPDQPGRTTAAARQAVVWTLFHYGITGWAMYAVMGLALAYFAFRRDLPLTIRSALYPIVGKRVHGRFGDAIDTAAVLGTMFGIATSLGIGVVQLNVGLNALFGLPQGKATQIGLIVVAVVMATVSVVSGLDKGIRRLSELNVVLAIVLLAFILLAGHPAFLLNGLVMNVGDYLSSFPRMALDTMAWIAPTEWMNAWTLFFWAWWIAWTPFVGLFLARISRGRTIREFVVGVLVIPFTFTLIWISVFGNSALRLLVSGNPAFAAKAESAPEAVFYALLEQYPFAPVVIGLATLTALLFYVTSADSGSLVMGNFTSRLAHPMQDCGRGVRIFWSFVIGLLTLGMLFAGRESSIEVLQQATIIMGLPFSFVLALVMAGLFRALRREGWKAESVVRALPSAMSGRVSDSGRARTWRQRLALTNSHPGRRATERFLDTVATPALSDVAEELASQGIEARVTTVGGPAGLRCPQLDVGMGTEQDFQYSVHPAEAVSPSYAVMSQSASDTYFRCEPWLREGSLGYTLNGWTRAQVIADVLDCYERHLHYLHLARSAANPIAPEEDETHD